MFPFFMFCVFFLISSITSCTPEDGFCVEETHSGGDSFSCSQMDNYFSETGEGIEKSYTSRKALYDGTFVVSGGGFSSSDSILIDKPDYIPEVISIEKMTRCTIAPSIGGVDCKQWYSFDFTTTDGDAITISSRNGNDSNENLALYYLTFETSGLELSGSINFSKITLNDTAVINSGSVQVAHKYTFVER